MVSSAAGARRSWISLPVEHGGYLTAVGAMAAATVVAPRPASACASGLLMVLAFLARGPLERRVAGLPWRAGDRAFLCGEIMLAAGLSMLVPEWVRIWSLVAALLVPTLSVIAKRQRIMRDTRLEALGLAYLGASAGISAWVGGVGAHAACALGGIMAAHVSAAVPLLRTMLRSGARARGGQAALLALMMVGVAAAGAVFLGRPWWAWALAPRVLHALLHSMRLRRLGAERVSASRAGIVETIALVLVVSWLAVGEFS